MKKWSDKKKVFVNAHYESAFNKKVKDTKIKLRHPTISNGQLKYEKIGL